MTRRLDSDSHTAENEIVLWQAMRQSGSVEAREALFSFYQEFARDVVRRHQRGRGGSAIEFSDLCQLAYAGLLEAIDGFDLGRGAPFKSYAVRRILGSVLDGVAKMSEVREQISFRNRIRSERIRSLTAGEAEHLPLGEAMQALVDIAVGLAIGFMLEDSGVYQAEERDTRANAYESLAWREVMARVLGEIANLPDREQLIIRSHYLDGLNFEKIADLLGITKGRVSQLHRASIATLKQRVLKAGEHGLEP